MDEDKIIEILTENFTSDPVEYGDEGGMSPYVDTANGTSTASQTETSDAVVKYWRAEDSSLVIATVEEIKDGELTGDSILVRLSL